MGKKLIVISIILGLVACFLISTGSYLNSKDKEEVKPQPTATPSPTSNPKIDEEDEEEDGTVLENSKLINKNENSRIEYRTEGKANKIIRRITPTGKDLTLIEVVLGKDKRTVTLTINWGEYNLTGDDENIKTYTITLEKNVKDVYVVGFGQAIGQECALYLMEDGTVEYNKIINEMQETTTLNSSGPIEGVTNIDRIETGQSGLKDDVGWGINNYAIRKDGKFYDLGSLLFK